eukprot:CAMPEP_0177505964 /NCGR_PEP_ID=MMETSP0369-20130122/39693_1 /TAXON_ID=447022 ORGANISM="Scrippsiella hangoei-like, Strain SHHI-4" /NCGR_SAMPLE_ID=MMETSP0369 /ASSEMBLY_ACC=CAM_ASM_000364 /LENGTH=247 /DNA_ID=CAMNT_0018983881 /DNA_START=38 /DNA_END=783 /DNA_ORIENTATION=+
MAHRLSGVWGCMLAGCLAWSTVVQCFLPSTGFASQKHLAGAGSGLGGRVVAPPQLSHDSFTPQEVLAKPLVGCLLGGGSDLRGARALRQAQPPQIAEQQLLGFPQRLGRTACCSAAGGKLDEFRNILGASYGVASVLHLADLFGPNVLPATVGAPPFSELEPAGQFAALVWVAAGGIAVAGTRLFPGLVGDLSLAFFALYEIWLVLAANSMYGDGAIQPIINVAAAQGVALAAYVYCTQLDRAAESN